MCCGWKLNAAMSRLLGRPAYPTTSSVEKSSDGRGAIWLKLILGISARDDHFGVRELQVQAEPPGELADQADRDRALLAAEAVVHDPGERGFAGAVVATDDVDL